MSLGKPDMVMVFRHFDSSEGSIVEADDRVRCFIVS